MKVDKQTLLNAITADMIACNVCPELAKTATHIVPGAGNPNADIVFIGEAPGKKEDETGQPFVGAAGKFLDKLLAHAGLKRQDVFITSIVKYRPPNNRDPLPAEKAASWPYLLRQLEVIKPKLVVTLGRHSMGHFLPGVTISSVHGTVVKSGAFTVMPLLHPAAALYNNNMKAMLLQDFTKLKQYILETKGNYESK